ncbi:hypothetical protein DFH08DRAFT_871524 [Mycena albidolilacea]|uniref:Uncharacterized protein n=1 Tax=Mycena albidolilacea TaxID=1033008 RepID=A0AAD6ZY71_9AGAR|nr:hypothetical protein DFH08DRAFT_871524 [Mycena albidolilacea]
MSEFCSCLTITPSLALHLHTAASATRPDASNMLLSLRYVRYASSRRFESLKAYFWLGCSGILRPINTLGPPCAWSFTWT